MGIVAMGGLGQATAKIAHYGFDMKILAVDIKPMAKPVFVDTLREPEWLMEMVPQVDVLVCCCPNTPVSRGMISDKVFRAMKKTAYFINISRGPLMDENALAAALKEGRIAGAGSDPGPDRAVSRHWRSLGLPEHDLHAAQRWILAGTPDPSHGAAGRERPPLRARLAAGERGGQRARLLIREEVLSTGSRLVMVGLSETALWQNQFPPGRPVFSDDRMGGRSALVERRGAGELEQA